MAECAIPMCCCEEGEHTLTPCCENGHFLHRACLIAMKGGPCPMCRSECIKAMMQSATLPVSVLCQTPYSQFGAAVAMCIGRRERERLAFQELGAGSPMLIAVRQSQ